MISHPWLLAARPRTLPAAFSPVLVGTALAYHSGSFLWQPAILCLIFALLIQIGTNFANDYYDWKQGADTEDRLGPSRAVASGWIAPTTMRRATLFLFLLSFLFGLLLIPWGGWGLIVIGIASLFSAYAYTAKPFAFGYRGLGDVFVIIFFGWVAVGATTWLQTGDLSWYFWPIGLSMGLLANNLLVVNNYRDRESDLRAQKRTLIVRFGKPFGIALLHTGWIVPATTAILLSAILQAPLAWISIIGLIPVFRAVPLLPYAKTAQDYQTILKLCSAGLCLYALLLSFSLLAA